MFPLSLALPWLLLLLLMLLLLPLPSTPLLMLLSSLPVSLTHIALGVVRVWQVLLTLVAGLFSPHLLLPVLLLELMLVTLASCSSSSQRDSIARLPISQGVLQ